MQLNYSTDVLNTLSGEVNYHRLKAGGLGRE